MSHNKPSFFARLIVLTGVVVAAVWAGYGFIAMERVQRVGHSWQQVGQKAETAHHAFHSLYQALGYGGLIHHFKDYVLRKDERNAQLLVQDRENIQRALALFQNVDLTPMEQRALTTLEDTLEQYFRKLDDLRAHRGSADIGPQVHIDDQPAVQALAVLQESIEQRSQKAHRLVDDALDEAMLTLRWGWIWVPLLLLFVIFLNTYIRQLAKSHALLMQSQQEVDNLLEAAPEAMLVFNVEGRVVRVNTQAEKLFGYSREELMALTLEDLMPERFRQRHAVLRQGFFSAEQMRRAGMGGSFFILTKSGVETEVEIGLSTLERPEGRMAIASLRDVGERIRQQNALIESEERLNISQQIAHLGTWDWYIDSGLLIWSDECYRIFGYQPGEQAPSYEMFLEHIHPDDRQKLIDALNASLEQGIPYQIEHRIVCPSGEIRIVVESGEVYRDKHGVPKRMVGIVDDVTEAKEIENALRESEQRFRNVFDSAGDGLMVLNSAGTIMEVNGVFCERMGYSREEVIGQTPQLFNSPEQAKNIADRMAELRRHGHILFESVHVTRDGHSIPVEVNSRVVEYGDERAILSVIRDITERKEAERLSIQAKKAAEAANQAKSEFLANMSHEIRTPMNAIIGLSQLALGTQLTDKQYDYVSKIQSASKSLLSILNDILDYSKIEAGKLQLENTNFALDELIDQLSALFVAPAEEKGLELFFHVDPRAPRQLVGDPLRLSQILINLMGNAVKFTDAGEVELKIERVLEHAGHVELRFMVRDTGIGIPAEKQQCLFEAFGQVDTSISRKYGGTGLGLSISQNLAHIMGGALQVKSEPGKGSIFFFTLRFALVAEDVPRYGLQQAAQAGQRVLIVDDQETSRLLLREMLESWHYEVSEAASAGEAMQQLEHLTASKTCFDLILLDWQMPDVNGLEVARQIRRFLADAKLPHAPTLIMVSAHQRDEVIALAEEKDFDAFLTKPVTPSSLLDTIINLGHGAVSMLPEATPDFHRLAENIHGAHVLLVEDNDINQQVAGELLRVAGLHVSVARNGREAVGAVENENFDAVLMDLQMPEMDGFHATRIIRRSQADLPIIAMTAAAMQQDKDLCLAEGMNDYVAKPINPEQLIATLVKWIKPTIKAGRELPGRLAESGKVALPPSLPGVNINAGVRTVGGNRELYRNLLLQFARQFHNAVEALQRLLQAKQLDEAQTYVHSLKGVAGNLAAQRLHAAAEQLHENLKAKQMPDGTLLTEFNTALAEVLTAIAELHAEPTTTFELGVVDAPRARQLLSKLEQMLEHSELIDSEMLSSLRQALGDSVIDNSWDEAVRLIASFNYDPALAVVRYLRHQLEEKVGDA